MPGNCIWGRNPKVVVINAVELRAGTDCRQPDARDRLLRAYNASGAKSVV